MRSVDGTQGIVNIVVVVMMSILMISSLNRVNITKMYDAFVILTRFVYWR